MTALSGVLSSWDMLARNSDLWRLAISSSARLVSSSPKSRALTMARPDWLAKVRSSSGVSSPKSPGVRRRIPAPPTSWSWRTSGTASRERQPSASSRSRCSSRATAPRSGTSSVVRSAAARPTSVETRRMCSARSRSVSAGSPPAVARTRKQSVLGVVLHDRAAVRAGEPYGAADDAAQHLVEVQRRADRVADLPQHLELVHLGRQLLARWRRGPRRARPAVRRWRPAQRRRSACRPHPRRRGGPRCATPTAPR